MSKKTINPLVKTTLEKYGLDPKEALWDCHGTWVIRHVYCELIAQKAAIEFSEPKLVYFDPEKSEITLFLTAKMGERSEWTYGEVSRRNNQNAYPWAMAEKRAKDRLVLKLAGIHGMVYSEDEIGDEPRDRPPINNDRPDQPPRDSRVTVEQIKEALELWRIKQEEAKGKIDQQTWSMWVQDVCGRPFNTGNTAGWTINDYKSVVAALTKEKT